MKKEIFLDKDYITLGQFLKKINIVASGGQAKYFLNKNFVLVNGEIITQRGFKIRRGMIVEIQKEGPFIFS